jgi:hypothetical protein
MEKPLWELWFAPAGWAYLMAQFGIVPGLCHSKADERRQPFNSHRNVVLIESLYD